MEQVQIVPAVIPDSWQDLGVALARFEGVSPVAHVDLCDGRAVPRRSWPFVNDGGEWSRAVAQEVGLPQWERFEFEFDLMVADPLPLAREAIEAGASRVILHLETLGETAGSALEALRADGRAEVWLAAGVGFDLSPHMATIGLADGFQQMGIKKIGFQGQAFDASALDGVRAVRAAHPELPIALDGGVTAETAAEIVRAGATKLIAGSAILAAENPRAAARAIAAAAGSGV